MDLVDFEGKLIAKLIADVLPAKSIEIRSYPDDFERYVSQLTHPGGAILSVFQGTDWNDPEPNNKKILTQPGIYNWQFSVLGQNLSSTGNQNGGSVAATSQGRDATTTLVQRQRRARAVQQG